MNRLLFLRNPVWVIGAVAAFVFSLSACGEDSGNSSYNANDFSLQVESKDELPNCSKNRLGDIAEVLGEKKVYVCDNGRWEFDHDILDSVETEDDLSACLDKNEGDSVWVVEESAVFACIDRKWEKHEISSSSVKKETSSSSKPLSSSSISQKSSSSVISSSSSVSSPMSSWSGGGAIGSITDSRDGQTYKTVTIGTQTWMAQNLNFETANSYCYNDSTKYCEKYGRLYMWGAAMDSAGTWSANGKGCGFNKTCSPPSPLRGVCPTGWHLPTKAEFLTLFTAVGGMSVAGKKLKSTSGWKDYNEIIGNGTDDYSFSALPASNRDRGGTSGEGYNAYFWSSTEDRSDLAIGVNLRYINDNAFMDLYNKDFGLSVRCVKGEAVEQSVKSSSSSVVKSSSSSAKASSSSVAKSSSSSVKSSSSSVAKSSSSQNTNSSSSSSSVKSSSSSSATSSSSSAKSSSSSKDLKLLTDYRDGQTYKTVTIGWQTWMAENLNYETKNSFCYNDKPSNCTKYGRLYTWAAAMDSAGKWSVNAKGCGYLSNYICSPIKPVQGVCPVGWHLPSVQEWNTLLTSYQEASDAGKVLKSTSGWNSSGNGTDAFSFSALPAGIMWYSVVSGVYNYEGDYAYFWSSTEYGESHAYYMSLHYSNDGADLGNNNVFKHDAISVRCLKN